MPRGQPLNTMNPFSNNKPRLTASERIRNKRDAAIYQGEKQRFQRGKNKCRNRNVKFYKNGKVRSVINYKMQKSLARGNVLCNDCDDKGNLCAAPSKKDDFASIYMGNNAYSEYWGGARVDLGSGGGGVFTQTVGFTTINSDVSGSWGGSLTDISKSDLSGAFLPGSDPSLNMPFGYLNNLINIPRNLDGSGIVIDPSNVLFPNELCDPFRYLAKSYLKTYLIIRAPITEPDRKVGGVNIPIKSTSCFSDFLYKLIGRHCILQPAFLVPATACGIISSICCVGKIPKYDALVFGARFSGDDIGLFDIYIELFYLQDVVLLSNIMNTINNTVYKPYGSFGENFGRLFPLFEIAVLPEETFINNTGIFGYQIQSLKLIQGSIPPSMNQTLYNSTKQSYMSCLENSTRKINFTKQNLRLPVINGFCTPAGVITCNGDFSWNIINEAGYLPFPSGTLLSSLAGANITYIFDNTDPIGYKFKVENITNTDPNCSNLSINVDFIVVGGGGSGGLYNGGSLGSNRVVTTGGGGGGQVVSQSLEVGNGSIFEITIGKGSPGTVGETGALYDISYNKRFQTDASSTVVNLSIPGSSAFPVIDASPGVNGANATRGTSGSLDILRATDGGAGGGFSVGGVVIDPSTNSPNDGKNPEQRGSAGGGGGGGVVGLFDGMDSSGSAFQDASGLYPLVYGNGGNGGTGFNFFANPPSPSPFNPQSLGAGGGGAAVNANLAAFQDISGGLGGGYLQGVSGGDGASGGTFSPTPPPPGNQIKGADATQYGGGGGGSVISTNGGMFDGGAGKQGVVYMRFYL